MLRTRLLWFTLGFSVSGAAIAQFVWRDLLTDRYALASDLEHKFDGLAARVQNLENIGARNSNTNLSQVED
ncbi:uncharacterized protein LOC119999363 [Tripterygium wilfordii]|uniref:uncharacterized protein LOC119999363 n=1 Tax=Tripterygium wilfordii TaxID=458696 RepID=UPI0018F7EF15|nr:uncharacterized protein LOC119999363 [Tripterygium wilfordii]